MSEKNMILDMIQKRDAINMDIYRVILQNPYVRDLPDKAALFGLFSRFLIGEEDVYFAFGYNKAMVYGEFIEACGAMIPESVVKKCGYFIPEVMAPGVCCLDCTTMKIDANEPYAAHNIIIYMQKMDFYSARYMRHNMKVPMYCVLPEIGDTEDNFVSLLDNKAINNGATRQAFWLQEEEMLRNYAIPEWPISPTGQKPGLLAFTYSRYMRGTVTDPKVLSAMFDNPSRWNDYLFALDARSKVLRMPVYSKDEAQYIIKGMKKMNTPCEVAETMPYEKRDNRFFKHLGLRDSADVALRLDFHSVDYGAFIYWKRKYIAETYFTEEQKEYGRQLYFSPETASYLFTVQRFDLEDALRSFKKSGVKVGFPEDAPGNLASDEPVQLIVDISDLPLALGYTAARDTAMLPKHSYGLDFNSTIETRRYAKMRYPADHYQSLYVTSNEPCYKGEKTYVGRVMRMDGTLSDEIVEHTFDPARTPKCIPISEVLKSKLMIMRPEWEEK